jgi:hypothetical protein
MTEARAESKGWHEGYFVSTRNIFRDKQQQMLTIYVYRVGKAWGSTVEVKGAAAHLG